MEDNKILELIKNNNSKQALQEMEGLFKQILVEKLEQQEASAFNKNNFMQLLDYSIKTLPQDYDILTYLRNTYFFAEKTDSEKLYELAYIYENLKSKGE